MLNNRSNSFLKRFKTEKTERNYMIGWKPTNKTPSSRNQLSNRSPLHSQIYQKIQLKDKDNYIIKCINHPLKKATFQPKQSLKQAFCQDCSIRLVKSNIRMVKISEESLYLRSMYETQIERIFHYQQEVKQLIGRFFQNQRQSLRVSFTNARQMIQKPIKLPYYKIEALNQSDFTTKIQQIFGSIQFKKIQFIKNKEERKTNQSHEKHQKGGKIQLQLQQFYQSASNNQKQNIDSSNLCLNNKSSIQGKLKRMGYREVQKIICHR